MVLIDPPPPINNYCSCLKDVIETSNYGYTSFQNRIAQAISDLA